MNAFWNTVGVVTAAITIATVFVVFVLPLVGTAVRKYAALIRGNLMATSLVGTCLAGLVLFGGTKPGPTPPTPPEPPEPVVDTNMVYTVKFEPGDKRVSGKAYTQTFWTEYNEIHGPGQTLYTNRFVWTGRTFDSWTDTNGVHYADGQAVDHDLTSETNTPFVLTAQWSTNRYSIVFDANGGEGAMDAIQVNYDARVALPTNSFWRSGVGDTNYVFRGWMTNSTGIVAYGDGAVVSNLSAQADGEVRLYARWNAVTAPIYYVDYAPGGDDVEGVMSPRTQTVRYGNEFHTLTNCYRRLGYRFDGWNDLANNRKYGENETLSNLTETVGGKILLTAAWTPNAYVVRYRPSGGTGIMSNQVMYVDAEERLQLNGYVRPGYRFCGWDTNGNGLNVVYEDQALVVNLSKPKTDFGATNALYAVWKEDTDVEYYEGTNVYSDVVLDPEAPTVFTKSSNLFDVTFATGGTYRVSLDPMTGTRKGVKMTVLERETVMPEDILLGMTNDFVEVLSLTDRQVKSVEYAFATNCEYRFSIATGTNHNYAVGIGLPGVQMKFHGLAGTIAFTNTTFNLSVGYPIGISPEFTSSPSNNAFMGWYDGTYWPHATKVETSSLVSAERPDLYAGWAMYENAPASMLELHRNDVECGDDQVVSMEFAAGFPIGDLLPMLTCTNHSFVGWKNLQDGSWWTATKLMPTNTLALYGQWEGGFEFVENGSGWTVTGYRGEPPRRLVIPEFIGPNRVTGIGDSAFEGCTNLTDFVFDVTPLNETEDNGGFDFLWNDIFIGTAAFKGCSSLRSFELPLGVRELPDELFADCTSLTNSYDGIPYTVTEVGSAVFTNCISLVGMTIPEYVAVLGDHVFAGCVNLKIVRYLGEEPAVGEDVYRYANDNVVSAYLSANNWTNDLEWATSSNRKIRPLSSGVYKTKKVTYNYNNAGAMKNAEVFYIVGNPNSGIPLRQRVLGLFVPDEEGEPMEDDGEGDAESESETDTENETPSIERSFDGWFTERIGGDELRYYHPVAAAETYYAHWVNDSGRGGTNWEGDFYEEDSDFNRGYAFNAAVYDGFLMDGDAVAGTFLFKAAKGKFDRATGSNATFKVTIQIAGMKKATLSGVIDAGGNAVAVDEKKGLSFTAKLSQFGLSEGEFSSGAMNCSDGKGARDRFSAKSADAIDKVREAGRLANGSWTVLVKDENDCWSVLSVVVGNKGKTRISGTLASGVKVSVSSKLIVGDGCCCVPVVYSKKNLAFGFALWFTRADDGSVDATLNGLSGFADHCQPSRIPAGFDGEHALQVEADFEFEDFSPDVSDPSDAVITVKGAKWALPKPDGWKFVRDEGWDKTRDNGNETGLKLTYAPKTGTFKGSYKIYGTTDAEKSKKYTVNVFGAIVNQDGEIVGKGSATIKKVGAVPITIE